jgi:hypothetical protein
MITLNDQDLEALLKVSDKELVKLAVAPTAAIRLRRDAACAAFARRRGREKTGASRTGFPAQAVADQRDRGHRSDRRQLPARRSRMRRLEVEVTLWQGWTRRPRTGRL